MFNVLSTFLDLVSKSLACAPQLACLGWLNIDLFLVYLSKLRLLTANNQQMFLHS